MVIAGVSSSGRGVRGGGLVELYRPPPMRQRQLEQKREKDLQSPGKHKAEPPLLPPPPKAATESEEMVVENRVESDDSSSKPSVVSPFAVSLLPMPSGNLRRFLKFTTPTVPARYSSQTNGEIGELPTLYFKLGDLWESFKEWSVYGAGVPLVLNGSDSVIQYYVPFLSAIQLYPSSSRPNPNSRRRAEESDDDNYQDTSSDISSESETEQMIRDRRESLREASKAGQEGFYRDDGQVSAQLQLPLFQYLEHDPPYGRQPLADKISVLASKFPDLLTYRSCDLLSSSWMSVAWYPIYRIPIGSTLQDLDACFLTFHTLTGPLEDTQTKHAEANGPCMDEQISLPVFGLASYKFRGSVWNSNQKSEQELPSSLLQAAEKWLQLRHIDHPDFRFFINRHNTSSK